MAPTRILIVEDDPLIGMELEDHLLEAGFEVVGVAPTVARARRLAEAGAPDAAVLDMQLRGETSFAFAREMVDAQVPCVFVSGNDTATLPEHLRDRPVLAKPVDVAALAALLSELAGTA